MICFEGSVSCTNLAVRPGEIPAWGMIKVNDKRFMENDWDTNISCMIYTHLYLISYM